MWLEREFYGEIVKDSEREKERGVKERGKEYEGKEEGDLEKI